MCRKTAYRKSPRIRDTGRAPFVWQDPERAGWDRFPGAGEVLEFLHIQYPGARISAIRVGCRNSTHESGHPESQVGTGSPSGKMHPQSPPARSESRRLNRAETL